MELGWPRVSSQQPVEQRGQVPGSGRLRKTEGVSLHHEALELEPGPWTASLQSPGVYNKQAIADAGCCGLKFLLFPVFLVYRLPPQLPAGKQ